MCAQPAAILPTEKGASDTRLGTVRELGDWRGPDLAGTTDWQYRLTRRDVEELVAATTEAKRRGQTMINLRSKLDFPLAELGATLTRIGREVHHGRGFVLVKGLPVDQHSRDDIAMMYWGMGLYIGYPVSQNAKGHMLGHVVALGDDSQESTQASAGKESVFMHTEKRGYNTRQRFHFHTDSCDVVALCCLHHAMSGGESIIVSSVAIHNEIARRRPDLLEVLYQPFWVSRQREVPVGARPYYQMPVFHQYRGAFMARYTRAYIESCKIFPELPALTEPQVEAFDLLDSLATDPFFYLSMQLEKGDIQFLNNHVSLHTRTAYEDFAEPIRRRHLLRLWLVSPEARALPHWYYDAAGGGRRAGLYVGGVTEVASLEP